MGPDLRAAVAALLLSAGTAQAEDIWVAIYDQPIKGVLANVSAAYGIPVMYDDTLKGRVRNVTGRFSAKDLLTRIAAEAGLVWFDDGNGVHVTKSSDVRSFVIDTAQVSPDALQSSMQQLGFYDARFPIFLDVKTGMGLVSGPPRYLELVRNSYAMLAKRTVDVARPQKRRIAVMRGGSTQIWNGIVPKKDPAPAPVVAPPIPDEGTAQTEKPVETDGENG
ncbi:hypothetical protein [uncultured Tateyamaria sp.]|uniref:hypothetical protein n=1 Tax=uncultured Tateyamaria sp. TaxID=455651 RepID=UPI002625731C|nr:hypothetical protein [uncultured Tateyamaria sp.]